MKQSFSWGILLFFLSSLALGEGLRNPLQRTCLTSGGQFWIYGVGSPDQYPVCRFGLSEVGALDLLKQQEGLGVQSVSAFLSSASVPPNRRSCVELNARIQDVIDSEGVQKLFCFFTDGSLLERETLLKGPEHPDNKALKTVLESF